MLRHHRWLCVPLQAPARRQAADHGLPHFRRYSRPAKLTSEGDGSQLKHSDAEHRGVRATRKRSRTDQQCPAIGDLFWRDTMIDAAVFREWMVGMGRRSARGRIAHLLCEILMRLKAVG